MKQSITESPPHPAGHTAPQTAVPPPPAEERSPGLRLALWVWLAGFGLLVAELILQALEALIGYLRFGGAGH